jgi:hypothetical protein
MAARFKVAITAILLVSACIAYAGWSYLARIDTAAQRSTCSDRLIGYAFDAAAQTLSAPPAPHPQRMATAADFVKAASRLTNADAVCARTDNRPRPLPRTPVDG